MIRVVPSPTNNVAMGRVYSVRTTTGKVKQKDVKRKGARQKHVTLEFDQINDPSARRRRMGPVHRT